MILNLNKPSQTCLRAAVFCNRGGILSDVPCKSRRKNEMLNRLHVTLPVVFCAFLMTACSKPPEEKIIGIWYEMGATETTQFFADGTIKIVADDKTIAGSYSFLDERNLKVELTSMGGRTGTLILDYEFTGDILRLTYEGDVTDYSQSKEVAMKELNEIQAQVESGLILAGAAKASVSEYTQDKNRFPRSNEQAGLSAPTDISGEFVSSIEVQNGTITVTYGGNAATKIAGKELKLTPRASRGSTSWTCKSYNIDKDYLPESCR